MALVSPEVARLRPYEPGKPIDEVRRELGVDDPVKLASNENAWGVSPRAVAAIAEAARELHLYPDGGCFHLRRDVAAFLDVAPGQLVFGNGSNELIELLVKTFVQPGQNVVTSAVSFVAYKLCTLGAARELREAPLGADMGFDLDGLLAQVDRNTRLIFIANPNNPTGTCLGAAALDRFVAAVDDRCAADPPILVLDEAYIEYQGLADYPDSVALVARRPRTVALRTFSKAYGLAGARCGYAVTSPELVDLMERVRQPFNVNSLAQVGAQAALADQEHVLRCVGETLAERARVHAALEALGHGVVPSHTNFLLVDFHQDAAALHQALMRRGVICRPMGPYGLTTQLRITIGLPAENDRLLAAVAALT